jgi:nucleoside-diphosphate-sugar epimerase
VSMLSKIYAEAMSQHAEIPFSFLRPRNVYGSRMGLAHVVPELLRRAHVAARWRAAGWHRSTTGGRSVTSTTRSS